MAEVLDNDNNDVFTSANVSGDAGDLPLLDQSNGTTEDPDPVSIIWFGYQFYNFFLFVV